MRFQHLALSTMLVLALAATAACGEKAIELHLELPSGDAAAFDVSCVNQVVVSVYTELELTEDCIAIDGATTLAEVEEQMRGKFQHELPEDLLAFQIHGRVSDTPDQCATGDLIFYAGTNYLEGDEDVDLPVVGTLDCSVHAASPERAVRLVDFKQLVATPAGLPPSCAAPGITLIEAGTMHPSNLLPPEFSPTVTSTWQLGSVVSGVTNLPIWNNTLGVTCPSMVTYDELGFADATACVQPGMPTVCGGPGEIEVPIFDWESSLPSYDDAIQAEYLGVLVGTVWDAVAKTPVANARVQLVEGEGRLLYGTWDAVGARFVPNSGNATTTGGMFILYANDPVVVQVTSGLHQSRTQVLGAPWGTGASAIIALQPN